MRISISEVVVLPARAASRARLALLCALAAAAAAVPLPADGAESKVLKRESKAPHVLFEPTGYEKIVQLVSGGKEYQYFLFSPKTVLTLQVEGPTSLTLMVRLLFDKTMKGTQDFALRIEEEGLLDKHKEVGVHALKGRKSSSSVLKDLEALVPSKSETLDLLVPAGQHTYHFVLSSPANASAILRVLIPTKDLKAGPARGRAGE